MHLYSKTIEVFLTRIRTMTRTILREEMSMEIQKSRILYKRIFYPLNIVVFEDNSRLGYFDSRSYELGLSKKLMYQAQDEVIKNILRHELAHFVCFIKYGNRVLHGGEFHDLCRSYGWGQDVYSAYANIELENSKLPTEDEKTQKLLARLKKLLALASSDNANESETATIKANELLLEHNLDLSKSTLETGEEVCVLRVLSSTRKTTKHVAIYEILKTFYVSPVFNHGSGIFYLEVIGDRTSVELAEYVANFLDRELEKLWIQTKKDQPNLKGKASKNSFFRGVSKGYVEKIENQKKNLASSNDLVVIEKNIERQLQMVYPRIGHSSLSAGQHREDAHSAGKQKGANLSINPAIKSQTKNILKLT
jgi:predicted metal-dependent hydrolase